MGVAAIPYALAAVSAAGSAYQTNKVAKDQDTAAAQAISQNAKDQSKADDAVSAEVQALEKSSPEAAKAEATQSFMDQLRRNRTSSEGAQTVGNVSDAYSEDAAGAKTDINQFGQNAANVMARISAPALQRQKEGQSAANLATQLSGIARTASGNDFLNQLRQRSIRANPWVTAATQVGSGVASGMASNGYGVKTETYKPSQQYVDTPTIDTSKVYG